MLADGCPLGGGRWESNCESCWDGSVVSFWRPPWRITLWHMGAVSHSFSFLPFQIYTELGEVGVKLESMCIAGEGFPVQRQDGAAVASCHNRWAQLGNKQCFCMGGAERPSHATNFDTDSILSCCDNGKISLYRGDKFLNFWKLVSQKFLLTPKWTK